MGCCARITARLLCKTQGLAVLAAAAAGPKGFAVRADMRRYIDEAADSMAAGQKRLWEAAVEASGLPEQRHRHLRSARQAHSSPPLMGIE